MINNLKLQTSCFIAVSLFHLLFLFNIFKIAKPNQAIIPINTHHVSIRVKNERPRSNSKVKRKVLNGLQHNIGDSINHLLFKDKIGNFGDSTGKEFGRDSNLYEYLYEFIKQRVYYPRDFMHLKVEGSISARLAFDLSGNLEQKKIKISGTNRYMVSYFKNLFVKIFLTPLPHSLLNSKYPFTIVDVSVKFIFDSNEDLSNLSYRRGREFGYTMSNHYQLFKGGIPDIGEIIDRYKENFTDKGKSKKQYWIDQVKQKSD